MFRRTISFFAPMTHIASTRAASTLEALQREHFVKTFPFASLEPAQKQRLLHDAIRQQDYKLAEMFVDQNTIFSKDEYGDTPVVMALNDKAWYFLECAKKHVVIKSPEVNFVLRVIRSEADHDAQDKMLGCAKDFFEIEQ